MYLLKLTRYVLDSVHMHSEHQQMLEHKDTTRSTITPTITTIIRRIHLIYTYVFNYFK
jgi:hypothetical protein